MIVDEQAATEVAMCQVAAGHKVVKNVKKNKMVKCRVETLRQRYVDGYGTSVMEYIDGVSRNLKLYDSSI